MSMNRLFVAMGLVLLTSCATENFAGYVESLAQCIQHCNYEEYDIIETNLNDSLNNVLNHTNRTRQLNEWTNDDTFVQLFWNNSINLELTQEEFNNILINCLNNEETKN